jgi:hypothetical protein
LPGERTPTASVGDTAAAVGVSIETAYKAFADKAGRPCGGRSWRTAGTTMST